jgi:trimethylamine--corrinoid protein Co-methyltransferase
MLKIIERLRAIPVEDRYVVLSREGVRQIHNSASRILTEVGFKVEHPRMLKMLTDRKHSVETNIVRVAPERLAELLAKRTKPQAYVKGNESQKAGIYVGYLGNQIYDPDLDIVRYPTRQDLDRATIVALSVPGVLGISPLFEPKDCAPQETDIAMLDVLLRRLPNPTHNEVLNRESLPVMLDMCAVAAGSWESALRRGMLIYHAFITSPLKYDYQTLDMALFALEHHLPVRFGSPMTIAGVSGPVTLAGTLALTLAEAYSGLVLADATGQSWSLACSPVILDPADGASQYGGPDRTLLSLAMLDFACFLGIPPDLPLHLCTDATKPGLLAGIEKSYIVMLCLLAGLPPMLGMGGLLGPGGLVGCIEQILIDAEIVSMLDRLANGIHVSEDTIAYDLIARAGIDGSFLAEDHTAHHFRNELWFPSLFHRLNPSAWNENKSDMLDNARKKVREILASRDPRALSKQQEQELDAIIAR